MAILPVYGNSESGMSLLSSMIGLAVASLVVVGVTRAMSNLNSSVSINKQASSELQIKSDLRVLLGDQGACDINFSGLDLSKKKGSSLSKLAYGSGKTFLKTGDKRDGLEITDLTILADDASLSATLATITVKAKRTKIPGVERSKTHISPIDVLVNLEMSGGKVVKCLIDSVAGGGSGSGKCDFYSDEKATKFYGNKYPVVNNKRLSKVGASNQLKDAIMPEKYATGKYRWGRDYVVPSGTMVASVGACGFKRITVCKDSGQMEDVVGAAPGSNPQCSG